MNNLITIEKYSLEEIFEIIPDDNRKQKYKFNTKSGVFNVNLSSNRLKLFKKSTQCVCCNLSGNVFLLQKGEKDLSPHLNLFFNNAKDYILFTKDHIVPLAAGGTNTLQNYQTMCIICNNIKSDHQVSLDILKSARKMFNDNISRKNIDNFLVSHQND